MFSVVFPCMSFLCVYICVFTSLQMRLIENIKLSNILCRKGKKREAHSISIIFLKIMMVLCSTSWCINRSYYEYLAVFDIKCKLFHNSLSDIIYKPLFFFIKIFFHPSKAVSLPNILENCYIYMHINICIIFSSRI